MCVCERFVVAVGLLVCLVDTCCTGSLVESQSWRASGLGNLSAALKAQDLTQKVVKYDLQRHMTKHALGVL